MLKSLLLGAALLSIFLLAYNSSYDKKEPGELRIAYNEFQSFKSTYKPVYSTLQEELYRFMVFQQNLKLINEHNSSQDDYVLGVNQFADLTWDEIKSRYLGLAPFDDTVCDADIRQPNQNGDIRKIDWKDLGKVTEVKNQKQCGSCWAFSAVASIESIYAIKRNENIELSEQQLIDCSREYNNHGCSGGMIGRALKYATENPIATESNYPYQGHGNFCKADADFKYKIDSCVRITPSTTGLIEALKVQPVSIAMSVELSFAFYKFGIYNPRRCSPHINHAMLAVGFNLDHRKPYFHGKNSWGKLWGWFGYFKIAIGNTESGTCNIAGSGHNFVPVIN